MNVSTYPLPNSVQFIPGFSMLAAHDFVYIKCVDGLYKFEDSRFIQVDLPKGHTLQKGNNFAMSQGKLATVLHSNTNECILGIYDDNDWKLYSPPSPYVISPGAYIGVKFKSFFIGLNRGEKRVLHQLDKKGWHQIDHPDGLSMSCAAEYTPDWYCPYIMLSYHKGLHMVYDKPENPGTPYSYQGMDNGVPVFEQWVASEGKRQIPGTSMACDDNKLIAFFMVNGVPSLYKHVPEIGLAPVPLPDGYQVAPGYPAVGGDNKILMILVNGTGESSIFSFSNENRFEMINLPNQITIPPCSAMTINANVLWCQALDGTTPVLLKLDLNE